MKEDCFISRKGENIYKRKDGRWEGRYLKGRDPFGKAKYGYVYAKTYREVRSKLRQLQNFRSQMVSPEPSDRHDSAVLSVLAQNWFEAIQPQLKESTCVKYRNILKSYIIPGMGSCMLSDLTNEQIESYCNELLLYGGIRKRGLSSKTVADILAVLRSILRFATRNGEKFPCDAYAVQIKSTSKEMKILSHTEQETLCKYLYAELNTVNAGILLCLFTGLRVGEVCALKWEDISIDDRTIHIHQTMQRIQTNSLTGPKTKIIITSPKSKCSVRTIPLPEAIMPVILSQPRSASGFFLAGKNDKIIEPRTMQNHFKKILNTCGIDSVNYHALRHTFATRCVELGFDVKSLSEILGHASVNITMNRYVHPSMELKRKNMQKLSSLFAVR